jgi:23S rRNA pseudouridine1911/1915/1917 synthase
MSMAGDNSGREIPTILYEDNHLLVAIKPAGWLSQADSSQSPDMLTELKAYLKQKYNKPGEVFLGLVHRLDQPVSGIMVFARTSKAASRLSEQVREHRLERRYLAVIHSRPEAESGDIHVNLLKDKKTNITRVDPAGLASTLHYRLLAFDAASETSLVEIQLGTGRSHQIRVSFAYAGWPLVFDQKYGLPRDRGRGDVALFAWKLAFEHPTKRERLEFAAPLPKQAPFDRFAGVDIALANVIS